MDTSFFSERPSDLLRMKIDRVFAQIRRGVHKSKIRGDGPEFRGFRPWDSADNPARINYPASFRLSPDLEEVVVRTSYGEKKISVVTVLDMRTAMGFPRAKLEHAGALFWLFALSAFKELDRFRAIVIFDGALVDSGWTSGEDALGEFLNQEVMRFEPKASLHEGSDGPIALLADLRLCDAFLAVISDFCSPWDNEIAALNWLGMYERNVRGLFLAMDEWSDARLYGYGMDAADPRTGAIRRMSSADIERAVLASQERFASLAEELLPHPVSFFQIPLTKDPIAEFLRVSMGSDIE